jgi:hypothetical protein
MFETGPEPPESHIYAELLRPTEHRVRLLMPFWIAKDVADEAALQLTELDYQLRKVWEIPESQKPGTRLPPGPESPADGGVAIPRAVSDLYRAESLAPVSNFLFSQGPACCRYLRVVSGTANAWFRNYRIFSSEPGKTAADRMEPGAGPAPEFKVRLGGEGIELFVSPHGAGLLCITLLLESAGGLRYLQAFNYQVSQLRENGLWKFRLPISLANANPRSEPGPSSGTGGFTLAELADFLLEPLKRFDFRKTQEQFSTFTITRFGRDVQFSDPSVSHHLRKFLAALTHVEEPDQVGTQEVTARLLNSNHWAAVGNLGASHLLSDWNLPYAYDAQRLPTVYWKYFIPYIVSLMQRLTLQHFINDAAELAGTKALTLRKAHEANGRLHEQMLRFTAQGYFIEVSSREVLNQYYQLAQTGLRVPERFEIVRHLLHDLEVTAGAHFQETATRNQRELAEETVKNVRTAATVQSKIEWLEVFFVSYYATALTYYIAAKAYFVDGYSRWSLLLVPIFSGIIAFLGIRPDQVEEHRHSRQPYGFLIALLVLLILWAVVGILFFTGRGIPAL